MIDPTELANILAEAIQIKYEKEVSLENLQVKEERHWFLSSSKTEIEILSPAIFYALRTLSGVSIADFRSEWGNLFREEDLHERPKSKSVFMLSKTKKYIMKTISKEESMNLRRILLSYLEYCQVNPQTYLNRYLLLVKIHKKGLGTPYKGYVVVVRNIFRKAQDVSEVYDLKGRLPKSGTASKLPPWKLHSYRSRVIEDKNLVRNFRLSVSSRNEILSQLRSDFEFLCKHNMMDYSLLVGVAKASPKKDNSRLKDDLDEFNKLAQVLLSENGEEEFYVGIIDTLSSYNLKKKIAHLFKSLIWRKECLSTIPPKDYCERIIAYSEQIFLSADSK